jgi:integrase
VRAFLSHASEDKEDFVEPLAREFAEIGVAPWLDMWEIRPGDSLVRKLFEEGLDTVDAVIVVVSASSAAKPWVREELDAAVVRRITSSVRLIPVRLDGASVPAPIQHLVWITADRTPEGIRKAAREITDAVYARDRRPAVAQPPAYTTAAAIPGLTQSDSALLAILIEEALAAELLMVTWPVARAKAEGRGMTPSAIDEAFAALENRRYLKVTLIELGTEVGLRPGELYGLHGHRVDWLRGKAQVIDVMARSGLRQWPKSKKSHRIVPVPAHILEGMSALMTGRPRDALVFTAPEGGPVDDGNFRDRIWYPAVEAAGIRRFPPRIMRHTAASWLVIDGVPLYDVQALLGHESYRTTERYAHLAPDAHDKVVQSWARCHDASVTHERKEGRPS